MAAVSVVPTLVDALITAAEAALNPDPNNPTATVYDGIQDSEEPGDYLMIGVDDPEGPDWARAASGTRDWDTVGLANDIDEEGDLACAALSWNGDGDPKAARDAVYAIAEALATVCRTTPTLGLPRLLWVLYGGQWDLKQVRSTDGACLAQFTFQIHFRALI